LPETLYSFIASRPTAKKTENGERQIARRTHPFLRSGATATAGERIVLPRVLSCPRLAELVGLVGTTIAEACDAPHLSLTQDAVHRLYLSIKDRWPNRVRLSTDGSPAIDREFRHIDLVCSYLDPDQSVCLSASPKRSAKPWPGNVNRTRRPGRTLPALVVVWVSSTSFPAT